MKAAAADPVANPAPALFLVRDEAATSAVHRRAAAPRAAAPRAAAADDEAIRELWRANGPALMRFALKLTVGNRQHAEDIVQEALLRAWRHPEVIGSGKNAVRSWLYTIIRRIAIDQWRARSRIEEMIGDQYLELASPAEPIDQAITALDVRAALAKLSSEHRQVLAELYYHGRLAAEVAEVLGIPVGTVRSRAHYALRELREAFIAAERAGGSGFQVSAHETPNVTSLRVSTAGRISSPPASRRRSGQHSACMKVVGPF
jgi:RNA polymerase sigma-70 factor (ECF subfamily)